MFFKIVYRKVKRYIPNHKSGVKLAPDWWFGNAEGYVQMRINKSQIEIVRESIIQWSDHVLWMSATTKKVFFPKQHFKKGGEDWLSGLSLDQTADRDGIKTIGEEFSVDSLVQNYMSGALKTEGDSSPVIEHSMRVYAKLLSEQTLS